MSEKRHVQQDVEGIGQRHEDSEGRSPRKEHQSASDRFEEANPKNQIARPLQRKHELANVIWGSADRITVDGKAHRHDSRAEQEECEKYPCHQCESWKSNPAFFKWIHITCFIRSEIVRSFI